jgi:hypothetical protein
VERVVTEEIEWVPAIEGGLFELKELSRLCEAEGIPSELGMESCDKEGCTPKAKLLVPKSDVDKLATLLRNRWKSMVEAEGVQLVEAKVPEDGDPPCPACGTAAPLVEGACSDCGLVLE